MPPPRLLTEAVSLVAGRFRMTFAAVPVFAIGSRPV
jgi:hypothetical protein